jgi:hypothetical protein
MANPPRGTGALYEAVSLGWFTMGAEDRVLCAQLRIVLALSPWLPGDSSLCSSVGFLATQLLTESPPPYVSSKLLLRCSISLSPPAGDDISAVSIFTRNKDSEARRDETLSTRS